MGSPPAEAGSPNAKLWGGECGGEEFVPAGVAFGVHVEAVVAEEFFAGLAVVAEEGWGGVDVGELLLFSASSFTRAFTSCILGQIFQRAALGLMER